MRPETRYAKLLEEMPAKPEYREALTAAIAALRMRTGRGFRVPRPPPDIAELKEKHLEELHRLYAARDKREAALIARIESLEELVHPSGTWQAGKDPRRRHIKSLYCSFIARWGQFQQQLIEIAREDSRAGFRWWPRSPVSDRVEQAARALFDASMELAKELAALEGNAEHSKVVRKP